MKKCFTVDDHCIGHDCQKPSPSKYMSLCRREEIKDEHHLVQSLIDVIDDCKCNEDYLNKYSSKLSFLSHTLNNVNNDYDLKELLNIMKRCSILLYEFKDKIVSDYDISHLIQSFSNELKKWLEEYFLYPNRQQKNVQTTSILSDFQTIEMSLGTCILETNDDFMDDMFF